jgi:DNA-binding CsgD family transcriptional regulator
VVTSAVKETNTGAEALRRGRELMRNQAWGAAFAEFSAADREAPLESQDLLSLALIAHLLGRDADNVALLSRAHQSFLKDGEVESAVRCAFWLGFSAMLKGDMAQAGGWLARARRLLDDGKQDCVESGYLLLPVGYRSVQGGDAEGAYTAFSEAAAIGDRFGDADLVALGRQGQGRALIRKGEIARGIALLDEVMVAVTAGEVSPSVAGGVYCSVIEACGEILDFRRAQEWTDALEQWCTSQPDIVPFRGHCQVRRAEILQLHGAWTEAVEAARQACEQLSKSKGQSEARSAFYCLAELHRLRGEFTEAEAAYRRANHLGKTQQPGLALLLLAQGQTESALAAIRNIAPSVNTPSARARVLEVLVDVMLGAGDVAGAHTAAEELAEIAAQLGAPLLHATSARAQGAVLLAEQDSSAALVPLRHSLRLWRELNAPFEAARARVLLGQACREQGDHTSAELEFDAARAVFQQLGAKPDLERLDAVTAKPVRGVEGPLTAREIEVLALVATGKTNRAIAKKLFISEKTVARHISNIFGKLDVSSRSAATAYAYEHKLA